VAEDRAFHHRRLPPHSALLAGRSVPDELAFESEALQVWFNDRAEDWTDPGPHLHTRSDEMFVVLDGALLVEVDGEHVRVGPGEFCCFPAGSLHQIVSIEPPIRTFMIRAPSVDDKVYPAESPAPVSP
jgi:mannose-6-phosphate isomerase-like protein (cupin superfamily)